jgi:hypothetical protein
MIYFRSNHRNFSTLIRETSALYVACEALVIINVIKGVGEEKDVSEKEGVNEKKNVSDKIIILLIPLSLFSLRLIRCIFDR